MEGFENATPSFSGGRVETANFWKRLANKCNLSPNPLGVRAIDRKCIVVFRIWLISRSILNYQLNFMRIDLNNDYRFRVDMRKKIVWTKWKRFYLKTRPVLWRHSIVAFNCNELNSTLARRINWIGRIYMNIPITYFCAFRLFTAPWNNFTVKRPIMNEMEQMCPKPTGSLSWKYHEVYMEQPHMLQNVSYKMHLRYTSKTIFCTVLEDMEDL